VWDDEIDPTAVSQTVRRGHQLREGYAYLQRVIEHVTGQPLAEHMWTNVLEPLGMHSSSTGEDSFWHWGANVPFHAFAAGSGKQRMGIIAMTNSESGRDIWKDLIPESIGGEHPEISWLKDLYEQMPT
jgi:CubicO group peptidase (beta-lactamase class C family)